MPETKLGADASSADYWQSATPAYVAALDGDYHQHRLSVIRSLIPDELRQRGAQVFDFGCGDGVLFPEFLDRGVEIEGCDPDPAMVQAARNRLKQGGYITDDDENPLVGTAGVGVFAPWLPEMLDGLFAFNVLAYLTDDEEAEFYAQARRILRPGGYLVVTHSNSLFDLFALNGETERFFEEHLIEPEYRGYLDEMLSFHHVDTQTVRYNIRENPLAYPHKLRRLGFEEIRQTFSNRHPAPPALIRGERTYPDTLRVEPEDAWKDMLRCSTYGSLSRRL